MRNGYGEETCHIPVLRAEVVEMLEAGMGGTFLDLSVGGGGHSEAILEANPANTLCAVDRDARAIKRSKKRLSRFADRVSFFHGPFSEIADLMQDKRFDGAIADLGLSTDQLYENRGFSFNDDAALDMRMDESQEFSANEIVNTWDAKDLYRMFKDGGVDKEARSLVDAILRERPIQTTQELSRLINKTVAGRTRKKNINPATVAFQALRMAVNREREELKKLLAQMPALMKKGGRLAIISFHSGEDKIIAGTFREWASGSTAPAYLPDAISQRSIGKVLTKKAISSSEAEIRINPASRSARLRVFLFAER